MIINPDISVQSGLEQWSEQTLNSPSFCLLSSHSPSAENSQLHLTDGTKGQGTGSSTRDMNDGRSLMNWTSETIPHFEGTSVQTCRAVVGRKALAGRQFADTWATPCSDERGDGSEIKRRRCFRTTALRDKWCPPVSILLRFSLLLCSVRITDKMK